MTENLSPSSAMRHAPCANDHLDAFPRFPDVTPLTRELLSPLRSFVGSFPPYSDFNVASMWAWDVHGLLRLSRLGSNLVVRFGGYSASDPGCWSLLGREDIDGSIQSILDKSSESALSLVPDCVVKAISDQFFSQPDRDNYDYIYDVSQIASLVGSKLRTRRQNLRRFWDYYGDCARASSLSLQDQDTKAKLLDVFDRWAASRPADGPEHTTERASLSRLVEASDQFDLLATTLLIDEVVVGYTIYEVLPNGWAIGHSFKTDRRFDSGVALLVESARRLEAHGVELLNFEQDLGVPGLRENKSRFGNGTFLKKYHVSYRSGGSLRERHQL